MSSRGVKIPNYVDDVQDFEQFDDDEVIPDTGPTVAVPPRVDVGEDHESQDAAVARHAALPELEGVERVRTHGVPAVEDDPAQPAAEHHAEDRRERDEVSDLLRRHLAVAARGEEAVELVAGEERQHVREPVPVQPEAAVELHDERTELVDVVGQEVRHGER